jgi:hypothetical protein
VQEAWLSGAISIAKPVWNRVPDSQNMYFTTLPPNVKDVTGLRLSFGNEPAFRAVRARYPNGCTSTQQLPSGYLCQGRQNGSTVVSPVDGFGSNLLTELVVGPKPGMTQDNWTEVNPDQPFRNTGKSFQKFQLGVGGTCSQFVPPAGYWCGNACDGGAPSPPDCIARWPEGLVYNASVLPHAPYKDVSRAVVQMWHPGLLSATPPANTYHDSPPWPCRVLCRSPVFCCFFFCRALGVVDV